MRILLVKTSSLGDVVHNLPVASDLARQFPDATIDWVVEEAFAELPRLHPAIGRVIPVALRRWRKSPLSTTTWREIAACRRQLRATTYDAIIDTQGLLKSALIAAQALGPRFGFDRVSAREPLVASLYHRQLAVDKTLHAVERNRLLAAGALGYRLESPPDYGIAGAPLVAKWLPRGDYAVLLTATSRADKQWREDDWATLGMALITTGLRCVLPGGNAAERSYAASLVSSLGRAVAAPPLNLTDMAGLLAGASLVAGVDTGLVHLAAALKRPTLAIYCGSDPKLTGVLADGGTASAVVNIGAPGQPPSAGKAVACALKIIP